RRRGALLPHLFTIASRSRGTDVSCVFSVPLSVRLPCPGVTRRTALWSSDFPPLRPLHEAVARFAVGPSADRLAWLRRFASQPSDYRLRTSRLSLVRFYTARASCTDCCGACR